MARAWNIARGPRVLENHRRLGETVTRSLLERRLLALVAQHDLPWPQINRAGPGASSMRGLPEQRPIVERG